MADPEDPDVVPVLGDGEAHVDAGAGVGVLPQQVRGGGPVQPFPGAHAELGADGGVHEAPVDVGEPVDLGGRVWVEQGNAVLVGVGGLPGHEVLDVVLPGGAVHLLGDVRGQRVGLEVLRQGQGPEVAAGGCGCVHQLPVPELGLDDVPERLPGQTGLLGRQGGVAEPGAGRGDLDALAGLAVLEPAHRRRAHEVAGVDPAGSLHEQPVALTAVDHGDLAGEHDPVHPDGCGGVEHVGQVRVLPARADLGGHGGAVVEHAASSDVVRPEVLALAQMTVRRRAEGGAALLLAHRAALELAVGHGDPSSAI